jgi:hypothetical protein
VEYLPFGFKADAWFPIFPLGDLGTLLGAQAGRLALQCGSLCKIAALVTENETLSRDERPKRRGNRFPGVLPLSARGDELPKEALLLSSGAS